MGDESNLTLKQACEKFNVCSSTIYTWVKQGKIDYITLPSGVRRYTYHPEEFKANFTSKEPDKYGIVYARVSSSKQKEDLARQISFLEERYPNHIVYTDIGSGLNYKRRGFKKVVEAVLEGNVSEVVVTYKDRLSRFSFDFFLWLFGRFETKILVLGETNNTREQELVSDILSILTVFSSRKHGLRKYKTQIKSDKDLSLSTTEMYSEEVDGDKEVDLQSDNSNQQRKTVTRIKPNRSPKLHFLESGEDS